MIEMINPGRLARQDFFKALLPYLEKQPGVILRQIKKDFPQVGKLDKQLDAYIAAGYIKREDKRYYLNLPFLTDLDNLTLGQEVFLASDSPLYPALLDLTYTSSLSNETNQVVLVEETDFKQETLSLYNYFYRLANVLPLSPRQENLYQLLGDVHPQYALKYMTTFLLKFLRKDLVKQKRRDIFVDALLELGYLEKVDDVTYALKMDLDHEHLVFKANQNQL